MASKVETGERIWPIIRRAYKVMLAIVCAAILLPGTAHAISLKAAITIALEANPEIGEAISNREAIEFELRQARGLYLPSVDGEARYGVQRFDSPGTRTSGTSDDDLQRREVRGILTQRVFDGFNRRGERHRQASRVDSASHRIYERSESIALNVVRQYLEAGRLLKIVQFSNENIAYHKRILGDLKEGESGGSISIADRQQAEERVLAAEARLIEATEDLNGAKIRFFKLVGKPLDHFQAPASVTSAQPQGLSQALGIARTNNPLIKIAKADLDSARSQIKQARSEFYPKVDIELQGRQGYELEGVRGQESEVRAELVLRWNMFRGGIDRATVQEQLRRSDEERFGLRRAHRDVEETVRLSWDRRVQQRRRYARLRDQLSSVERLVESYAEQFKVGDRSLLDLLDTQNTRFNAQISVETARSALEFAEYRVLASIGMLLNTLQIAAPEQSDDYARAEHRVPETPDGETERRMKPGHHWSTRRSR
ncbi:MAG: TolC family outer membrane protein [Methyloligellaceae bacterium]